jgi:CelD/BcsL family acetyltransferase involved in cellulose biosynthesis
MRSRGFQTKLPVKLLTFVDHPETQVADVLCAAKPEAEEAFLHLIRHLVREGSSDWDVLALNKIPIGSSMMQLLKAVQPSSVMRPQLRSDHKVLIIPLRGTWEEYLSARSARFRKTLRNVANRIKRIGRVEVKRYAGAGHVGDAMAKLFSVADASWKLSSGVAITSSKGRTRFFEDLFRAAVTAEGLRIWIVEVDGRPIASETQVEDGRTVYALRSDYDERYADSSPGAYLQTEILKSLFASGLQEYNFGVGLNPYKARWTDQHVPLMSFRLYNERFYGRLLRSLDRCKVSMSSRFSGILDGVFSAKPL